MDVLKAIYQRRATRHFTDPEVTPAVVHDLIAAAAQAPSALNQQPWAFGILHGRKRLKEYSEKAKAHQVRPTDPSFGLDPRIDHYASGEINIFHGANTLIAVFAKLARFAPVEDCFLAAENLMLAAYGLGSCPVGFARPWFNEPLVKAELGVPSNYTSVLPIVIGYPDQPTPPVPKRDAETACWHWNE